MKNRTIAGLCAALAATLVSASALAQQITVKEPWVRATVPQQKTTGAFMQLTADEDVRLVELRSAAARVVEVHEMAMEGNVMKMRALPVLALPAGVPVELKPGGHHLMLIDLVAPVTEGSTVPLTLVVEGKSGKRTTLEVAATVRPLNAPGVAPMHKH